MISVAASPTQSSRLSRRDEISELSLYLWGPDKQRVTENRSENNRVSIGHCSKRDGMFRFEIKAASGTGTYKVGLYEKK